MKSTGQVLCRVKCKIVDERPEVEIVTNRKYLTVSDLYVINEKYVFLRTPRFFVSARKIHATVLTASLTSLQLMSSFYSSDTVSYS